MPNLHINTEDSQGNIHSISIPELVRILTFLKKRWEKNIVLCGKDPCAHSDITKIIEVLRRGWFDTTLLLSQERNVTYEIPQNIVNFEIQIQKIDTYLEADINTLKSMGGKITLEVPLRHEYFSGDELSDFCRTHNIRHVRYRIHHPRYTGKPQKSMTKNDAQAIFGEIIKNAWVYEPAFHCWINKELFSPEQIEALSEIWCAWIDWCNGYVGRFDIFPNGDIRKCPALRNIYPPESLRLENYESESDLFDAIGVEPSIHGCISEYEAAPKEKWPFDDHPGFYLEDNRNKRFTLRTTKELIEKKNKVVLPPEMIAGKTVLDLGSCIGAMWQWALFYGAKSYTWVEVQEQYVSISKKLLAHHKEKARIVQSTLEDFLSKNTERYDIVLCLWVIYVSIDYFSILKQIQNICNDFTVIESFYPFQKYLAPDVAWVVFMHDHGINLSTEESSLLGRGSHISPNWLIFLMEWLSMVSHEWILIPEKIYQGHDSYRENWWGRYMLRFFQKNGAKEYSLSEKLEKGIIDKTKPWEYDGNMPTTERPIGNWKFDQSIAKEFYNHAKKHIPHYEEVIELCIQTIRKHFHENDIRILEFGSAIGYTLEKLYAAWYENIVWIEKSESMHDQSALKEKVIVRDCLIENDGRFSAILANWTLHFIKEREAIIKNFFDHLEPGWVLIITDKVSSSNWVHELYLDFKRNGWVSENDIALKTKSLVGVLFPFEVEWYFQTAQKIGFSRTEILHASPSFVTFLLRK